MERTSKFENNQKMMNRHETLPDFYQFHRPAVQLLPAPGT